MKQEVLSKFAPQPIGPYSQAIKVSNFLFLSGQIPLDSNSGEILGLTIEEQTEQVLKNIAAILKEAGYDFSDIIKTTIFLKDINDFPKMNKIYERFFNQPYPVRSTVEVSNLPKGALVEIEAVAFKS